MNNITKKVCVFCLPKLHPLPIGIPFWNPLWVLLQPLQWCGLIWLFPIGLVFVSWTRCHCWRFLEACLQLGVGQVNKSFDCKAFKVSTSHNGDQQALIIIITIVEGHTSIQCLEATQWREWQLANCWMQDHQQLWSRHHPTVLIGLNWAQMWLLLMHHN